MYLSPSKMEGNVAGRGRVRMRGGARGGRVVGRRRGRPGSRGRIGAKFTV